MTDKTVDDLLTQALQLTPEEQALLMARLAAALHNTLAVESEVNDDGDDDDLPDLLPPGPLPPSEVIALGLTGVWQDVPDGAAWVNEQKRKRATRRER